MKRHLHTKSCSCTNCVYRSRSGLPSVQNIIETGSKIDRLYYGKYLPLRERKLLQKLIRTRAVYDDVRTQLLSGSEDETFSIHEDDSTERSSAVIKLVDLVDRGQIGSRNGSKLSNCCSCCECKSFKKLKMDDHPLVHIHSVPHEAIAEYTKEAHRRGKARRNKISTKLSMSIRNIKLKAKRAKSAPCTCTFKLFNKSSKSKAMKLRDEESVATAISSRVAYKENKSNKFKKCFCRCGFGKRVMRKFLPTSEMDDINSRGFRVQKDSLTLFREKLKKKRLLKKLGSQPGVCVSGECLMSGKSRAVSFKEKTRNKSSSTDLLHRNVTHHKGTRMKKRTRNIKSYQRVNRTDSQSQTSLSVVKRNISGQINEQTPSFKLAFRRKKKKNPTLTSQEVIEILGNERSTSKKDKTSQKKMIKKNKKTLKKVLSKKVANCYCSDVEQSINSKLGIQEELPFPRECDPNMCVPDECDPLDCAEMLLSRSPARNNNVSNEEHIKRKLQKRPVSSMSRISQTDISKSNLIKRKYSSQQTPSFQLAIVHKKKQYPKLTSQELIEIVEHEISREKKRLSRKKKKKSDKNKKNQSFKVTESTSQTAMSASRKELPFPRECDPDMCIPYECDPQDCADKLLSRSKSPNKKHKKKDIKGKIQCLCSKKEDQTQSLHAGSGDKLKNKSTSSLLTKSQSQNYSKYIKNYKNEGVHIVGMNPHSIKNVVRIGSTFKFNIEFHKDKLGKSKFKEDNPMNRDIIQMHQKNPQRNIKERDTEGRNRHQRISSRSTSLQSNVTNLGHSLKRCFCVLKIPKKKLERFKRRPISNKTTTMATYTSNMVFATPSKSNQSQLLSYECEPFYCIPGECDPIECKKRIRLRRHKRLKKTYKDVNTEHGNNRSTYTSASQSKKGISRKIQFNNRRHKNAFLRYDDISEGTPNNTQRQVVRIGSTFSFNIEFSKEKINDQVDSNALVNQNYVYDEPYYKKRHHRGTKNYKPRLRHTLSQTSKFEKSRQTLTDLKRCFCTLNLLKAQGTETPLPSQDSSIIMKHQRMATVRDRHRRGRYYRDQGTPCDPGECDPDECNPYECLKRKARKNIYTNTRPRKTRSINSSTHQANSNAALRRKKAQRQRNGSPKLRQAVRIGSSFSFNIDFYRDKQSDNNEYTNYRRLRQPHELHNKKAKLRQRGTQESLTSQSNIGTGPIRYRYRNKGISVKSAMKRCFCTLGLLKERKKKYGKFKIENDNKEPSLDLSTNSIPLQKRKHHGVPKQPYGQVIKLYHTKFTDRIPSRDRSRKHEIHKHKTHKLNKELPFARNKGTKGFEDMKDTITKRKFKEENVKTYHRPHKSFVEAIYTDLMKPNESKLQRTKLHDQRINKGVQIQRLNNKPANTSVTAAFCEMISNRKYLNNYDSDFNRQEHLKRKEQQHIVISNSSSYRFKREYSLIDKSSRTTLCNFDKKRKQVHSTANTTAISKNKAKYSELGKYCIDDTLYPPNGTTIFGRNQFQQYKYAQNVRLCSPAIKSTVNKKKNVNGRWYNNIAQRPRNKQYSSRSRYPEEKNLSRSSIVYARNPTGKVLCAGSSLNIEFYKQRNVNDNYIYSSIPRRSKSLPALTNIYITGIEKLRRFDEMKANSSHRTKEPCKKKSSCDYLSVYNPYCYGPWNKRKLMVNTNKIKSYELALYFDVHTKYPTRHNKFKQETNKCFEKNTCTEDNNTKSQYNIVNLDSLESHDWETNLEKGKRVKIAKTHKSRNKKNIKIGTNYSYSPKRQAICDKSNFTFSINIHQQGKIIMNTYKKLREFISKYKRATIFSTPSKRKCRFQLWNTRITIGFPNLQSIGIKVERMIRLIKTFQNKTNNEGLFKKRTQLCKNISVNQPYEGTVLHKPSKLNPRTLITREFTPNKYVWRNCDLDNYNSIIRYRSKRWKKRSRPVHYKKCISKMTSVDKHVTRNAKTTSNISYQYPITHNDQNRYLLNYPCPKITEPVLCGSNVSLNIGWFLNNSPGSGQGIHRYSEEKYQRKPIKHLPCENDPVESLKSKIIHYRKLPIKSDTDSKSRQSMNKKKTKTIARTGNSPYKEHLNDTGDINQSDNSGAAIRVGSDLSIKMSYTLPTRKCHSISWNANTKIKLGIPNIQAILMRLQTIFRNINVSFIKKRDSEKPHFKKQITDQCVMANQPYGEVILHKIHKANMDKLQSSALASGICTSRENDFDSYFKSAPPCKKRSKKCISAENNKKICMCNLTSKQKSIYNTNNIKGKVKDSIVCRETPLQQKTTPLLRCHAQGNQEVRYGSSISINVDWFCNNSAAPCQKIQHDYVNKSRVFEQYKYEPITYSFQKEDPVKRVKRKNIHLKKPPKPDTKSRFREKNIKSKRKIKLKMDKSENKQYIEDTNVNKQNNSSFSEALLGKSDKPIRETTCVGSNVNISVQFLKRGKIINCIPENVRCVVCKYFKIKPRQSKRQSQSLTWNAKAQIKIGIPNIQGIVTKLRNIVNNMKSLPVKRTVFENPPQSKKTCNGVTINQPYGEIVLHKNSKIDANTLKPSDLAPSILISEKCPNLENRLKSYKNSASTHHCKKNKYDRRSLNYNKDNVNGKSTSKSKSIRSNNVQQPTLSYRPYLQPKEPLRCGSNILLNIDWYYNNPARHSKSERESVINSDYENDTLEKIKYRSSPDRENPIIPSTELHGRQFINKDVNKVTTGNRVQKEARDKSQSKTRTNEYIQRKDSKISKVEINKPDGYDRKCEGMSVGSNISLNVEFYKQGNLINEISEKFKSIQSKFLRQCKSLPMQSSRKSSSLSWNAKTQINIGIPNIQDIRAKLKMLFSGVKFISNKSVRLSQLNLDRSSCKGVTANKPYGDIILHKSCLINTDKSKDFDYYAPKEYCKISEQKVNSYKKRQSNKIKFSKTALENNFNEEEIKPKLADSNVSKRSLSYQKPFPSYPKAKQAVRFGSNISFSVELYRGKSARLGILKPDKETKIMRPRSEAKVSSSITNHSKRAQVARRRTRRTDVGGVNVFERCLCTLKRLREAHGVHNSKSEIVDIRKNNVNMHVKSETSYKYAATERHRHKPPTLKQHYHPESLQQMNLEPPVIKYKSERNKQFKTGDLEKTKRADKNTHNSNKHRTPQLKKKEIIKKKHAAKEEFRQHELDITLQNTETSQNTKTKKLQKSTNNIKIKKSQSKKETRKSQKEISKLDSDSKKTEIPTNEKITTNVSGLKPPDVDILNTSRQIEIKSCVKKGRRPKRKAFFNIYINILKKCQCRFKPTLGSNIEDLTKRVSKKEVVSEVKSHYMNVSGLKAPDVDILNTGGQIEIKPCVKKGRRPKRKAFFNIDINILKKCQCRFKPTLGINIEDLTKRVSKKEVVSEVESQKTNQEPDNEKELETITLYSKSCKKNNNISTNPTLKPILKSSSKDKNNVNPKKCVTNGEVVCPICKRNELANKRKHSIDYINQMVLKKIDDIKAIAKTRICEESALIDDKKKELCISTGRKSIEDNKTGNVTNTLEVCDLSPCICSDNDENDTKTTSNICPPCKALKKTRAQLYAKMLTKKVDDAKKKARASVCEWLSYEEPMQAQPSLPPPPPPEPEVDPLFDIMVENKHYMNVYNKRQLMESITRSKDAAYDKIGKPKLGMLIEKNNAHILNKSDIWDHLTERDRSKDVIDKNAIKKKYTRKQNKTANSLKKRDKDCECCPRITRPKKKDHKTDIILSPDYIKTKPCICGSSVCNTRKIILEKKRQRVQEKLLSRKKPCVCGSKMCDTEAKYEYKKKKKKLKEDQIKNKAKAIKKKSSEIHIAKKVKYDKDLLIGKLHNQSKRKKEKKAKKLTKQQKNKIKLKHKLEKITAKQRALREKHYRYEDAEMLKARRKQDKRLLKLIKKHKYSDVLLCIDSISDVCRIVNHTASSLARGTYRAVRDPTRTKKKLGYFRSHPAILAKTVKQNFSDTGIVPAAVRIGKRISKMSASKAVVDKLESNKVTNFMLHVADKNPSKRLKKLRPAKSVREPLDFQCSLFIATLRKRPHWAIYFSLPWFYPHWLYFLRMLKHAKEMLLMLLAVMVWTPCVFCVEGCRAFVCCFVCTE